MTTAERIRACRTAIGLSMRDVGEKVGVSAQSVFRWENGARVPSTYLPALATALHTSTNYLIGTSDDGPGFEVLPNSKLRRVPVYESVSAGFGVNADDHIVGWEQIWIESDAEAAETLCIRAVGDSMSPKIEDGDLLQVQKVASIDSGRIGVFLLDGEDGVVKEALYEPGCDWLVLRSLNPAYRDRRFEGDAELARVRTLGLVRRIIKTV